MTIRLLAGVAAALSALSLCRAADPAPEAAGEKWTHKELFDHLTKNKLGVRMIPGRPGNAIVSPSAYFVFAATEKEADQAWERSVKNNMTEPRLIICEKMPSAEKARDAAGTNPKKSFAWGRFRFLCDTGGEQNLSKIHQAITGKPFRP